MSKPVLFVSFRPLERAENIHAIYNAYNGDKVHITTHDPNYRQEVLSGKYDLMVIDEFPTITPGKCIMIWHGIHGGKTIGLDQPGSPYYHPSWADNMTYIISASTWMKDLWHSCTGVPKDRILPLGFPRTDQYVGKHKGDGRTALAVKRAYLYVPTFRDRGETEMPYIDWEYIDRRLKDNEVFAIKSHPWYARNPFYHALEPGTYKHIIEIPPDEPTTPYLYDADVVVTDYSSIMFDAYLLRKPVTLFEKEQGYLKTRGMCFPYPFSYSQSYATTEEHLMDEIQYSDGRTWLFEYHVSNMVADMCDGHSCERLCKLIDDLNGGETPCQHQ